MGIILIIAIIALVGYLLSRNRTKPFTAKSNWKHYFPDMKFSAEEFYGRISSCIQEMQVKDINIGRESFLEKHIFSAKREYLRLKVNEYVFFVCAAPFGTGTFVSWWLCEINATKVNKIPIASRMLGIDRENKTFYQCDTENMYKSAIHYAVTSIVEEYGNTHGSRALSDLEMQYK